MGLDITAYRRIRKLDIPTDADAYEHDGFRAIVNKDFPGRADDIEDECAYTADDDFHFAAGSYGGFNDWREQLAILAGYPAIDGDDFRHRHSRGAWAATGGPFWELIHFADNEGTIGASVSAKLAKDFAEFQPKVDAMAGTSDVAWFAKKYAEWRKAFEMAADAGCVEFH